jgi:preprotein translocase subunit SecE
MKKLYEKIVVFLREAYQEFKKVRWPSREELIGLTVAVFICSIILMVFLAVIDKAFFTLVKFILG